MPKKKKPCWFTARCQFRSDTPGKQKYKTHLWEESFFLVWAISKKHAERRAKQIGRRRKRTYENFAGDMITWRFAELVDVHQLADRDFHEGTEVYSAFFARRNAPRLARQRKA